MTAHLLLYLPVGALHSPTPADLRVRWRREDGSEGEALLSALLDDIDVTGGVQLILSAADVHLACVRLTRKQAKHLHRVLPFVLEESLLEDIAEISFASGAVDNGSYAVAAVKRAALARLAGFFKAQGVRLDGIAVDADLLATSSPCVVGQESEVLLISEPGRALVVARADLDLYLQPLGETADSIHQLDNAATLGLLAAALKQPHIELLQRQWQLKGQPSNTVVGRLWGHWRATLITTVAIIALVWACMGIQYGYYQAASKHWQARSAALFQQLFPNDRATAKLRAQFRGHLARLGQAHGGGDFLSLMQQAGPVLAAQKSHGIDAQRLQFDARNQRLLLDIKADNYKRLQTLRQRLEAAGLAADISVANRRAHGVSARIKVGP